MGCDLHCRCHVAVTKRVQTVANHQSRWIEHWVIIHNYQLILVEIINNHAIRCANFKARQGTRPQ